jgi:hypothetical protein
MRQHSARLLPVVVCLGVLCLFSMTVQAGPILYTFTGTAPGLNDTDSFQYLSSQFITSPIDLYATQMIACGNCLGFPNFAAILSPNNGGFDEIQFNDISGVGNGFAFAVGALSSPGVYSTVTGPSSGTLSVQAVPEPSTGSLFGMAFIAALYCAKRKREIRSSRLG